MPSRLVHEPLQRELEAEQRRLRLKVSVERQLLELEGALDVGSATVTPTTEPTTEPTTAPAGAEVEG